MLQETARKNMKKMIAFIFVSILLIIGLVLFLTRPGSVTISTADNADIYIATERGGEFKKIGASSAVYKTRKVPSTVYIMSKKNGSKTISSALVTRGKNVSVTLKFVDKINATQVSEGAVFNAFLDGSTIQGIDPGEYTLINFNSTGQATLRPGFARLPYMKKVIWYDANNFIYRSFNDEVGRFINGIAREEGEGIGDIVTRNDSENDIIINPTITDIGRSGSRPLTLMSDENIYISDDMGSSLRSIVKFDPLKNGENHSLFTTNDHVYRLTALNPAAYAGESNANESGDDHEGHDHHVSLVQYNYDGLKTGTFTLDAETGIKALSEINNTVYALIDDRLSVINNDIASDLGLYFTYTRDLTLYKDKVVILADDGVWMVSKDGKSLQLLSEFPGNGVGLAQSFSISGDDLIFGTQARPGETEDTARMFSITF